MNILSKISELVKENKEKILFITIIFLLFLLAFGLGFLFCRLSDYQELKFEYENTSTSWNYY